MVPLLRAAKFLFGAFKVSFFRGRVPVFVSHYVNFKCNLRCSYCGTWKERTSELSTRELKSKISQFARAGTVSWNISGGEPLLRKDLPEIAKHARKSGMSVSINTNGTLLSRELCLKLAGIDLLSISLDGGKAEHEKNRGKGTFERALLGIRTAKESGLPVSIMAVISPANLKNNCRGINEIIRIGKSLGIPVSFQPLHADSYNRLSGKTEYLPIAFSDPNYKRAISIISEEKRKNPRLIRMSWGYIRKISEKRLGPCLAGKAFCIILPDGRIAPCFPKGILHSQRPASPKAFLRLATFEKCLCHFNCYSEWNLASSLDLRSLLHYALTYA